MILPYILLYGSLKEEVDKILWEITAGELGKAPAAASNPLDSGASMATEDIEAMTKRLAQLQE